MKKLRIEIDSIGPKKINAKNLWGAQTQRSLENFNWTCNSDDILPKLHSLLIKQTKFFILDLSYTNS